FTCVSAACATSCAADTDCATGFTCDGSTGHCIQGASCSADKSQSIDKSGNPTNCTPYLCGPAGTCLQGCGSTGECISGDVCDTSKSPGVCLTTSASSSSGSGCGVGRTTRPGDEGVAVFATLALLSIATRRRIRR
ncbi:MAG: hypothetical protein ACHREM_19965, partial [Polyangiales bacterium]